MHGSSNNLEFYLGAQLPRLTGLDLLKLRQLIDLSCFPGAECSAHGGMSWDKLQVDEWVERFRTDADFAESVTFLLGDDDGDDDGDDGAGK